MPRPESARLAARAANKGKPPKKRPKLRGPMSRRSAAEQAEQRALAPPQEESSSDESIAARQSAKPKGKGGPLSTRSRAEREEQAAIAARIQAASPAPGPAAAGAQRATPCLPCLRSALGGRSSGACFELAGAQRANRCLRCSSGHKCWRLPSAVRAPARHFVALLEAEADKKEIAKARSEVRRLLEEHPEQLSTEQPSEADDDDDDDDDDDEDDDEDEFGGFEEEEEEEEQPELLEEQVEQPPVLSARRAELKKKAKAGLHALVELFFSSDEE